MKIETAEEAWKALTEGKVLVTLYNSHLRLHGSHIEWRPPGEGWRGATQIGSGPWTVYKEPEKKPEPLEGWCSDAAYCSEPALVTASKIRKMVDAINWLLGQHKES